MYVLLRRKSSSVNNKEQILTSLTSIKEGNKMNNTPAVATIVEKGVLVGQQKQQQQHSTITTTTTARQQQLSSSVSSGRRNCSKRQHFDNTSLKKPSRCFQLMLVILALGAIIISALVFDEVNCQEQVLSIESRQQKDNDDLNDAIKYLEKLDKYFSQMARPRYGRSLFKQPLQQQHRTFANLGASQMVAPAIGRMGWTEPTRYYDTDNPMYLARLAQRYRDGLAY